MRFSIAIILVIILIAVLSNQQVQEMFGYEEAICLDCNVVILMIDTLRADHVGAYGYHRNTTPNIDKFAKESILFEQATAQSSWTRPSVASIFTGLYPKNHGAIKDEIGLPEDKVLLSEILKKNGYDTYAFSTNSHVSPETGFDQGFDNFSYLIGKPYVRAKEMTQNLFMLIDDLNSSQNNFIYMHFMDPHFPYDPPNKHFSLNNTNRFVNENSSILFSSSFIQFFMPLENQEKEEVVQEMINLYDDEVLEMDKQVGEVIKALKKRKWYDNTIIVVISDHGEEFYDHQQFQHGETLFEEQLRVPWIMRVPGIGEKVIKKQVRHIDLLPTLLSILGLPKKANIDGIEVLNKQPEISYAELNHRGFILNSIRSNKDKLIVGAITDREVDKSVPWPYWFKDKALVTFKINESIDFDVASFYGYQELQFQRNGKLIGTEILSPMKTKKLRLDLEENNQSIIRIDSLTPCKNVSELGIFYDQRCLSFGVVGGEVKKEERLLPLTRYHLLIEDPIEKNNLIDKPEFKERIKQLESELVEFIKNKSISSTEVNFSEEQLESLKSLGYI